MGVRGDRDNRLEDKGYISVLTHTLRNLRALVFGGMSIIGHLLEFEFGYIGLICWVLMP